MKCSAGSVDSCKMDESHMLIQFGVYAESNSVWCENMGHCSQYQTELKASV